MSLSDAMGTFHTTVCVADCSHVKLLASTATSVPRALSRSFLLGAANTNWRSLAAFWNSVGLSWNRSCARTASRRCCPSRCSCRRFPLEPRSRGKVSGRRPLPPRRQLWSAVRGWRDLLHPWGGAQDLIESKLPSVSPQSLKWRFAWHVCPFALINSYGAKRNVLPCLSCHIRAPDVFPRP